MAYGNLKVDSLIYDNSGTDVTVDISALAGAGSSASIAGNNTFTGTNVFSTELGLSSGVAIVGQYRGSVNAVSALDINLSTGNYFTKTINGNSTFTFSNPGTGASSFTLELTHTSGTVTWPASVKFNADTAPTLTAGKTHLFLFVTDDGGTRYRGAALVDYVN